MDSVQGQKRPGRFADFAPTSTGEVKNVWIILISHYTPSGRRQEQHFALAVANYSSCRSLSWVKWTRVR